MYIQYSNVCKVGTSRVCVCVCSDTSGTLNKNFSIAFSIIGMFSSHAVSNLSIFFCAEITPTVIR